jgi:cold shock CspA family protein
MSKEGLGQLVWFNVEKGVGEIKTNLGESYYFVTSELSNSKRKKPEFGDWVSFKLASFSIYGNFAAISIERATAQAGVDVDVVLEEVSL